MVVITTSVCLWLGSSRTVLHNAVYLGRVSVCVVEGRGEGVNEHSSC